MAFVYRSKRKMLDTEEGHQNVGPGSYINQHQYKSKQCFAPFYSTSSRNEKVSKIKDEQSPGPGSYNININTQDEKILVSTLDKETDIKIIEIPKENSVFKSKTDRFQSKSKSLEPGPGTYNPQEIKTEIKKNNVQKNK